MNKLIIEILPHIEQVANHTTKDYSDRQDIHQLLVLKCYDNKDTIKRLHKAGQLLHWLYRVAGNIKTDLHRQRKCLPLEIDPIQEEKIPLPIDNIKTLDEMLSQLNEEERLWIGIYIDCKHNIAELNRRTNISRAKATERINFILNKWKQLDIFLH